MEESGVLGGLWEGAAITVALVAAIENKPLRSDVAITGTINEDGTVGHVGSVFEKSQAAGNFGIKTFFVPKGLSNATIYEKVVEEKTAGNLNIRRVSYVPKNLDINSYTLEEYNMTVIEITNVSQILPYVFEYTSEAAE